MKLAFLLIAAVSFPTLGQSERSAFAIVQFADLVQVDLPRNWFYLDKAVADHLNTSSEAVAKVAGISLSQGDNTILVAANAYDSKGRSMATIRISVREAPSLTQAQMREIAAQPSGVITSQLRPAADETVKAMLNVPGVKSYSVRAVKVDRNGSLTCSLSSYDADLGRGPQISDTWICPLGDRTLKLTTSYEKGSQVIYRPTIERVWQSLRTLTPK